jgi:predicted RecB family nuclease
MDALTFLGLLVVTIVLFRFASRIARLERRDIEELDHLTQRVDDLQSQLSRLTRLVTGGRGAMVDVPPPTRSETSVDLEADAEAEREWTPFAVSPAPSFLD